MLQATLRPTTGNLGSPGPLRQRKFGGPTGPAPRLASAGVGQQVGEFVQELGHFLGWDEDELTARGLD